MLILLSFSLLTKILPKQPLLLDTQLEKLLERLQQFKFHCPQLERIPGFRRCILTQHIGLAYDVSGDMVTIVSVFDTRMDHPFH